MALETIIYGIFTSLLTLLLGICAVYITSYWSQKNKNLADSEDLKALTKKVEEVREEFSARRLQNENFINAKKDVYFESLNLVNRRLISLDYPELEKHFSKANERRNRGSEHPPTEFEMNTCYHRLYLLSGDPIIPTLFYNLMTKISNNGEEYIPVLDVYSLLGRIRKDLGNDEEIKDKFNYICSVLPK